MSERQLPSLRTLLEALIATPSVSSVNPDFDQGNLAVIELLAGWLEDAGFAVEILPLPAPPGRPDAPPKANLIATLGRGPGGLVLAGHTDTVPCDPGRWRSDPFRLEEREGRLHGLGTADMKSFLALALEAARPLRGMDLRHPLIILATADEESSMDGARALVKLGRPAARYAIIGEPTGLRPVHAHKGMMMEAIRIRGRAGHSSDPRLGANALEAMHLALGELLAWRADLQARYHQAAFTPPVPTLNPGHIHGGDNPNRICGQCELHFDLRPLPGMKAAELREELRHRLARALADSDCEVELAPLMDSTPPLFTAPDSPLVAAAASLSGHDAEAAAYCTEAPFLSQLGMDTVVLGPGDIAQAHRPDEYLDTARIAPTLSFLTQVIERFCIRGV